MIFYHLRSIFDIKIQKTQKDASKHVEMLVFCVNMHFQENSRSLCQVHTNIDYEMVIEIEPIY